MRPSEAAPQYRAPVTRGDAGALLKRLRLPVSEMARITRHPLANSPDFRTATQLVKALPSYEGSLSRFRHWQYLVRLSHSWRDARSREDIVIFDQGFVQALCSLAISSGDVSDEALLGALTLAGDSDLIVLLEGRPDLIESRLRDRFARQSHGERALERDISACLAWNSLSERLYRLLTKAGHSVVVGCSLDQDSLAWSVRNIEATLSVRSFGRMRCAE